MRDFLGTRLNAMFTAFSRGFEVKRWHLFENSETKAMFTFEKEEPADTATAIKMVSRVWIDARVYEGSDRSHNRGHPLEGGGGRSVYIARKGNPNSSVADWGSSNLKFLVILQILVFVKAYRSSFRCQML